MGWTIEELRFDCRQGLFPGGKVAGNVKLTTDLHQVLKERVEWMSPLPHTPSQRAA